MTSILVTRPQPDLAWATAKLRALGLDAVALPLMQRVTLDTELPAPGDFVAMAISSANALRALHDRGVVRLFRELPLYAVGDATAVEAEVLGFTEIHSARGRLADLVALIAGKRPNGAIFYPAGKRRSGDLGEALSAHNLAVSTVPVYDMVDTDGIPAPVLTQLADGEIDAGLIYSQRSAEAFVRLTANHGLAAIRDKMVMIAISQQAAEPLRKAGFSDVRISEHPHDEAMMSLTLAFAREQNTA